MVYIKQFFSWLWYWITYPYTSYKENKEFKKRLQEIKERDPFIYK